MKNYNPSPLKIDDIELSQNLLDLSEKIAENVHDIWASKRMSEGWVYGKERNDKNKTHPCLVSYSELPEGEKEYDRKTAMETLKFVMKLGYNIVEK